MTAKEKGLLTLNEAEQKAKKLTNENIPGQSTLRDWICRGYISRKEKMVYGGRAKGNFGLYDNIIIYEIVTFVELRKEIQPKIISRMKNNKPGYTNELYKEKLEEVKKRSDSHGG